jgi:hypothetical protein
MVDNPSLINSEDFDPIALISKVRSAKSQIQPKAAKMLMDLEREGKIPSWVWLQADRDLIELAAL